MRANSVLTDFTGIYDQLSSASCDRAVSECSREIAEDVRKLVPKSSGKLASSMRLTHGGTAITWEVPYAARQYWTNPKTTQWVKNARKKNGRKWAEQIKRALGL